MKVATTLRCALLLSVIVAHVGEPSASVCGDGVVDPGETCDPPAPPTCDCCQAHPSPGCDAAACEDLVCAYHPLCCVFGWNNTCAARALAECSCCVDCRSDCTYCGDGVIDVPTEDCDPGQPLGCDCCEAGGTAGCNDSACETSVCEFDPFCCASVWDFICAAEASYFLACMACCPRGQCTADCLMDTDGDGIQDADDPCVDSPNPAGGEALFGQTLFAAETKTSLVWPHEASFVVARGSCTTSFDVGGYVEEMTSSGVGTELFDVTLPEAGTALWYLLRPDCADSSWSSGGSSEIACTAPSDCCVAHGTPGCEGGGCESAVCLTRPSCCRESWDGPCADEANARPACVNGCDGLLCRDASLP